VFKAKPINFICVAKAIRTFGFGCISVILALYLLDKGFSTAAVGAIFSATIIEDAVVTTLVSTMATRIGLRRVLLLASALVVICGAALASSSVPWIIVCAAVFGIVSPAGYEGGPFSAVEQTIISDSMPAEKLTRAFSWYNLSGFAGAALGALFAGAAMAFAHSHNMAGCYQFMFWSYAAGGVVLALLYAQIKMSGPPSLEKEFARAVSSRKNGADSEQQKSTADLSQDSSFVLHKSKKHVLHLAGLQALDSFGGGFVAQSIIAYWFYLRFHAGPEFTGPVFFWANVLAAISFTVAPLVVKRIGLLRTMVFTHLPCSMALCLIPFMPDACAVAVVMLARSLFSSMDIPVRQAYSMLLVSPDERPAAAGIISASRAVSQGLSPLFSGLVMSGAGTIIGLPFIFAGVIKSVYDMGLYACFSGVRLPAEDLEIQPAYISEVSGDYDSQSQSMNLPVVLPAGSKS
jgi:MFS family permease